MWNKRIASFKYAFQGLADLFKNTPNAKIHLVAFLSCLLSGIYFKLTTLEWIAILLASGLVIAFEAINTALEYLTDLVSPDYHPLAGKAKDMGAAAVLVAAIFALIIGLIIFIPKVMACFDN